LKENPSSESHWIQLRLVYKNQAKSWVEAPPGSPTHRNWDIESVLIKATVFGNLSCNVQEEYGDHIPWWSDDKRKLSLAKPSETAECDFRDVSVPTEFTDESPRRCCCWTLGYQPFFMIAGLLAHFYRLKMWIQIISVSFLICREPHWNTMLSSTCLEWLK
jgi:hypothetical protein